MLGKSKATPEVNIPPPLPQLIQNSPLPGINALHLSQEACEAIQVSTMDQSENPIWFEQRKGRLTASKFYRICTRTESLITKKGEDASCLVNEVMLRKQKVLTYSMKHGLAMEPRAKKKLMEEFKKTHTHVKSREVGLFVNPEHPHIGASPDYSLECRCHGVFVCEIKCPSSIKSTVPSAHNLEYLQVEPGIGEVPDQVTLKQRHKYFFQVQGQMAITNIEKAIFFVYTKHGYHMEIINFDPELWGVILKKLNYFWEKHVLLAIPNDINKAPNENSLLQPVVDKSTIIKDMCGVCHKEVKDKSSSPTHYGIACIDCGNWSHISCVNVTEDQFRSKKILDWICPICSPIDFRININ